MYKSMKKYFPLFVLPTTAAFAIGFVVPFLQGLYLSFCDFNTVSDAVFTGFDNYKSIFSDSGFKHAFVFTTLFAIASLIVINVLAFTVAYFLTKGIRGTNIFRTIFFMPNLIGGIVLGYIWELILNGFLAQFSRTIKYSETYGFWGLLILLCWQQIGYMMIIYIAGLQAVPSELVEAAKIDGASPRQVLRHVTIPIVMPSITICTFLTVTNSFKLFDQNLSLTSGEPNNMSEMLALNIYNSFYGRVGWKGVGQAKAVIFCLVVGLIAVIQLKLTHRKEIQQ